MDGIGNGRVAVGVPIGEKRIKNLNRFGRLLLQAAVFSGGDIGDRFTDRIVGGPKGGEFSIFKSADPADSEVVGKRILNCRRGFLRHRLKFRLTAAGIVQPALGDVRGGGNGVAAPGLLRCKPAVADQVFCINRISRDRELRRAADRFIALKCVMDPYRVAFTDDDIFLRDLETLPIGELHRRAADVLCFGNGIPLHNKVRFGYVAVQNPGFCRDRVPYNFHLGGAIAKVVAAVQTLDEQRAIRVRTIKCVSFDPIGHFVPIQEVVVDIQVIIENAVFNDHGSGGDFLIRIVGRSC